MLLSLSISINMNGRSNFRVLSAVLESDLSVFAVTVALTLSLPPIPAEFTVTDG